MDADGGCCLIHTACQSIYYRYHQEKKYASIHCSQLWYPSTLPWCPDHTPGVCPTNTTKLWLSHCVSVDTDLDVKYTSLPFYSCFMNPETKFIWAFIAPVIAIIFANIVFFIMAATMHSQCYSVVVVTAIFRQNVCILA